MKKQPLFYNIIFLLIISFLPSKINAQVRLSKAKQAYGIESQIDQANYLLFKELFDSAQVVAHKAVEEVEKRNLTKTDLGLQARFTLASAQSSTNRKEEALKSIYNLIEEFDARGDWLMLSRSYLIAEQILDEIKMPERSLFYLKSCELLIQQHNIEKTYPWFCIRMWRYLNEQKDTTKALVYLEEALNSSKRLYELQNEVYSKRKYEDISLDYGTANTLMGVYYQKMGDKDKAEFFMEEATRVYQKVNNDFNMLWTYYHRARLHLNFDDPVFALIYSSNCQYLKTSIFEEYGFHGKYLQYNSSYLRSAIYEKMGQIDSAYFYHKMGYEIERDLEENKYAEALADIESKYEDELKTVKIDKQKEQLEREGQLRNWLLVIIILFFILTGVLIYFFKQLGKSKRKTEQQAIELMEVDNLKSNLFTNISHELKTPVSLIMGPLNYILEQKEDLDEQTIKTQLGVMHRNGQGLIELIEEILDLSKLEVGKLELVEESTDFPDFIKGLFDSFVPIFETEGLYFSYTEDLNTPLLVLVDRPKVKKIINNLLFNAMKFTSEGGQINVHIQESHDDIKVKVTDSGYGISEADLPHIFKRYFKSYSSEETSIEGSGIGLALSKEYAQFMGGDIEVSSILGKGSVFTFSMPKRVVNTSEQLELRDNREFSEEGEIFEIGFDYKILIVEDNLDMRNFLHLILEQRYKEVHLAKDGKEGLEFLKEHPDVDLIISDVMMPEIDGVTMVQTIKSMPEWKRIPVMMLTALNTDKVKLQALTIGVDDYLTKPFSVQELMVRIQNLLFNHQKRIDWNVKTDSEESSTFAVNEINKTDKAFLQNIREIIEDFPVDKNLTVDILAEQVFFSSKQLSRKLKALTGFSTAKYIKEVKLIKAKDLLEEGSGESISEIAYKSGFDNLTTFSAVFKKRFGAPPSKYLRKSKISN